MCTCYPIINRVSELKVHIELTRFVQPEKIEIDANERAVNEKSQYCFFVCTTFDSFLNDLKVPFQTLRTGSEGEIRNVWDLMEDYYPKSEDTSKVKNFLGNMSVFTRWYAYETRINDIFGDYEVAHKESS